MPRIKLAFWHGDKQPGDELEVTADELAALHRDGRVAEVLDGAPRAAAPVAKSEPEISPSSASGSTDDGPSGRKRR
ncbi:hypothetical protein AB0C77_06575 [Streptomyces sp. NPDC048629]|uniref:hypothetical protein n=1 Tax=Streptomyces sp. NPDC048629 TaxID=3154824 RepID=UPI003433977C